MAQSRDEGFLEEVPREEQDLTAYSFTQTGVWPGEKGQNPEPG